MINISVDIHTYQKYIDRVLYFVLVTIWISNLFTVIVCLFEAYDIFHLMYNSNSLLVTQNRTVIHYHAWFLSTLQCILISSCIFKHVIMHRKKEKLTLTTVLIYYFSKMTNSNFMFLIDLAIIGSWFQAASGNEIVSRIVSNRNVANKCSSMYLILHKLGKF